MMTISMHFSLAVIAEAASCVPTMRLTRTNLRAVFKVELMHSSKLLSQATKLAGHASEILPMTTNWKR